MKHVLSSLLVATALVAPAAFAQTTATTKPVGYESIPLTVGKFNVIGLRLQASAVASGALEAVGANTVTDNEVNFQTTLTAGKTYVLEITSGAMAGLTVEVTAGTGNNLNTVDNLSNAGVAVGSTYVLRPALTLEEIFGTTNSVLAKSNSSANADIVHVPDGNGSYVQYFLNNATPPQWRRVVPAGLAPNVQVVYTDGMFVEKKISSATLTVSGEVKTASSSVPVMTGFNAISTVYPAGVTLQNIGLEDDVQKSNSSGNADIIHVPDGSGGYTQYFLNNATPPVWRQVVPAGAAPANLALPPGVLIERKGAAKTFILTPPTSYSNL